MIADITQYIAAHKIEFFKTAYAKVFRHETNEPGTQVLIQEDPVGFAATFTPETEAQKAAFYTLVAITNMRWDPATEATQEKK